MHWDDIRKNYPNQWVKLKILHSHTDDEHFYVDDMEVIKTIDNNKDATYELSRCKGDSIVFHTSHEHIKTKLIKNLGLFRRLPS